jgi:acetyl-CoA carboxylase beta subunit
MTYSSAALDVRLDALLDPGTRSEFSTAHPSTAARVARGRIGGRSVWIAGTDASRSRGAIGVAEAALLCEAFCAARSETVPLFLLLDSAGAKVDEGLAALGAFRRLFREALRTRLAGVPMFALLGRACFGGASMLATICNRRVYTERTLIGASGPAVIQALSGRDQLDSTDAAAVKALMGGEARSRLGQDELLAADQLTAFRVFALELATTSMMANVNIQDRHNRLALRLDPRAETPGSAAAIERMQQLAPPGYRCTARGDVVRAESAQSPDAPAFVGVLSGGTIGAAASWTLADELLEIHRAGNAAPIILVLDAIGQAATRLDEALLQSEYITHFALTAAWLGHQGHRVILWIPGEAAGAIYVAFAAPAESVSALPSAHLRILPQAAVTQIVGDAPVQTSDAQTWIDTGVVDALLDQRLAGYATTLRSE